MNNYLKERSPKQLITWGLLTDQGSNLDSSEPKSDVLPVTPSVKLECKSKKLSFMMSYFLRIPTSLTKFATF